MTEPSCIFCRIVEGQTPAHIVWSDAEHVAFLDIHPITAGHVVLVPRMHVAWVEELSADAHRRLFERVRILSVPVAAAAGAPHAGIAVEGYGVAHAHVHLVPIWKGGDLDPCRQAPAAAPDLEGAAQRLRACIAGSQA